MLASFAGSRVTLSEDDRQRIEEEEQARAEARLRAEEALKRRKSANDNKKTAIGCATVIVVAVVAVIVHSIAGHSHNSDIDESSNPPVQQQPVALPPANLAPLKISWSGRLPITFEGFRLGMTPAEAQDAASRLGESNGGHFSMDHDLDHDGVGTADLMLASGSPAIDLAFFNWHLVKITASVDKVSPDVADRIIGANVARLGTPSRISVPNHDRKRFFWLDGDVRIACDTGFAADTHAARYVECDDEILNDTDDPSKETRSVEDAPRVVAPPLGEGVQLVCHGATVKLTKKELSSVWPGAVETIVGDTSTFDYKLSVGDDTAVFWRDRVLLLTCVQPAADSSAVAVFLRRHFGRPAFPPLETQCDVGAKGICIWDDDHIQAACNPCAGAKPYWVIDSFDLRDEMDELAAPPQLNVPVVGALIFGNSEE